MRSKRPSPFVPTRRSGCVRRSVVVRALDVPIHLRAEKAARERDARGRRRREWRARRDRDEHRARVGAVVRTGAADDRVADALIDCECWWRAMRSIALGYVDVSVSPTGSAWRSRERSRAMQRGVRHSHLRRYRMFPETRAQLRSKGSDVHGVTMTTALVKKCAMCMAHRVLTA